MNHWPFIIGAYSVTLLGTARLGRSSCLEMRRSEADVEGMKR